MRAAQILAAVPNVPPDIRTAILDLDARAYGRNEPDLINDLQLHARLSKAIKAAGSMSSAARLWGVKRQTVHATLNGDMSCPPAILKHLGLKRIPAGRTLYREV